AACEGNANPADSSTGVRRSVPRSNCELLSTDRFISPLPFSAGGPTAATCCCAHVPMTKKSRTHNDPIALTSAEEPMFLPKSAKKRSSTRAELHEERRPQLIFRIADFPGRRQD